MEEKAQRVKKKHKDMIVDIEELSEANTGEVVIQFSSLNKLLNAVDALLKPVLHKARLKKHAYCVMDGATHYQYLLTTNGDERKRNG